MWFGLLHGSVDTLDGLFTWMPVLRKQWLDIRDKYLCRLNWPEGRGGGDSAHASLSITTSFPCEHTLHGDWWHMQSESQ